MITDHGPKEKNQTFKFSLCEIKTKPIDICIDIPIVNSKPIRSTFHQEFSQQGSSFLRTVRSAIILLQRVRYNKDWGTCEEVNLKHLGYALNSPMLYPKEKE